jgi:hypothetical protein
MCSPTMTIPIRQRDTRSAAWPRVTFVVRREPTVELSPSRDQLYCSLAGLSRHNPQEGHKSRRVAVGRLTPPEPHILDWEGVQRDP